MRDDNEITTIQEHLAVFVLDDEAKARLGRRLDDYVATAHPPRPNERRRIRLASISTAVACAAALVLVVALGPDGRDHSDGSSAGVGRFVGPDTAAAQELVRAGDRAAKMQWGPLADGEYYHLYRTSVPGDTGGWGVPSSSELWMNHAGEGQMLTVTGTNDPDRLPDPRGGGYWAGEPEKPISIEESLTKANSANLITFPGPDEPGVQRTWTRNANGFHKTYDSETSTLDDGGTPDWKPEQTMRMYWWITAERIDDLPDEGGAAMDKAIETLLTKHLDESPMRSNRVPTGAFGVTQEQLDREERINLAVNLLGSAPLPPEARRSLYRWLAKQPGAKLTRGVKDAIGRSGSRITFEYGFDERVPAAQFTAGELLDRAHEAGAEITGVEQLEVMRTQWSGTGPRGPMEQSITRDHEFDIEAHHEKRTWRVTIVIDPETGDLLQQQLTMEKRATADIVEIARHENKLQLILKSGNSTEHEGGSGLYLERGIARIDEAKSPVCKVEPKVCRL